MELYYKWKTDVQDFHMPLKVVSNVTGEYANRKEIFIRIFPTTAWQKVVINGLNAHDFEIDSAEFYVKTELIKKLRNVKL